MGHHPMKINQSIVSSNIFFNRTEILFLLHLLSTFLIVILHPFVVIGGVLIFPVWTDSIQVRVTGHLVSDAESEAIFNIIVGNRNSRAKRKARGKIIF